MTTGEPQGQRTVFVTGAAGFLGRHVSQHLSLRGWIVIGIGHGEWTAAEQGRWGLSGWIRGDVNGHSLKAAMRTATAPHAILHCAGGSSVGFSLTSPKEDFHRTVVSTMEVLEFTRNYAPGAAIVYPSSAAIYGTTAQSRLCEEQAPNPVSPYGLHKFQAEQLCAFHARQWGLRLAVIRFFSLYGPGLRKQLLWDAFHKARKQDHVFWGSGQEVRDWLFIADAARLLEFAMAQASHECPVVNGGTGVGQEVRDILTMFGSLHEPRWQPVFSNTQKPGDPSCLVADVSRIQAWGFSPSIDLYSGMRMTYDWLAGGGAT